MFMHQNAHLQYIYIYILLLTFCIAYHCEFYNVLKKNSMYIYVAIGDKFWAYCMGGIEGGPGMGGC